MGCQDDPRVTGLGCDGELFSVMGRPGGRTGLGWRNLSPVLTVIGWGRGLVRTVGHKAKEPELAATQSH